MDSVAVVLIVVCAVRAVVFHVILRSPYPPNTSGIAYAFGLFWGLHRDFQRSSQRPYQTLVKRFIPVRRAFVVVIVVQGLAIHI